VTDDPEDLSPIAKGYAWVARITTVVAEMVLFGVGGHWLDQRWGTRFLTPLGFVLGVSLGLYHLLVMTGALHSPKKQARSSQQEADGNGGSNR
jgi:hypothetical protein